MSSVAALQLEKVQKTESVYYNYSTNTNRFASLPKLPDSVQTSEFNRRTRLIIIHRLAVLTSSVAVLKLELS
eukprot:5869762-Pyramimonas_sp.AAC.1